MKKIRWQSIALLLLSMSASASAIAVDLLCLYYEAQINDSTLQTAKETQLAARQALPLARAQFLPVIDFQATFLANNSTLDNVGSFHTNTLNLTLTQPVIHFEHWRKYAQASNAVKSANATYTAAEQDLIIRLAQAYFGVLQAIDNLYYARSSVKAFQKFLEQTEQRFEVGLIAITDVEIARAQHDNAIALAIAAENEVNNQREKLRIITGRTVGRILPLREELTLTSPDPLNIEQWVSTALAQNFQLQASRFTSLAAKNQIKVDHYAHLPTVDIIGQVERSTLLVTLPGPHTTDTNIGVQVNFPISRGGGFIARTRQSIHNYLKSDRELETLYRNVEAATRQSYRSVLTQISQIKALKQATISNQSALDATHASFNVGTRTIVDVLNAQTDLIRAQQSFAASRYSYIIQSLLLKQASGTLCENDVRVINTWLIDKPTRDLLEPEWIWIEKQMNRSKRLKIRQKVEVTQEKTLMKTGKPAMETGTPVEVPEVDKAKGVPMPAVKRTGAPTLQTGTPETTVETVTTIETNVQKGTETPSDSNQTPTTKRAKPSPRGSIQQVKPLTAPKPLGPTQTAPIPTQTTPASPSILPEPPKPATTPERTLPNTDQFNRPLSPRSSLGIQNLVTQPLNSFVKNIKTTLENSAGFMKSSEKQLPDKARVVAPTLWEAEQMMAGMKEPLVLEEKSHQISLETDMLESLEILD